MHYTANNDTEERVWATMEQSLYLRENNEKKSEVKKEKLREKWGDEL